MATTRKAATKKPPAAKPPTPQPVSEVEKQAKLEAYNALKQAGVTIPQELLVVEDWVRELQAKRAAEEKRLAEESAQRNAELAEANKNGPWYVRNGYPAPFNLRLDRQTEKRRIELKPRGTPGDLHPLKEEDLKDPVLNQNLALGLIEVLPAGEAQLIIEKQMTNNGARVHSPLAVLRNELDQAYKAGAVRVEAEFNSQGVTVAAVDPRTQTGQLHDKEVARNAGLNRVQPGQAPEVNSGFVPTAGQPAQIQYGGVQNDIQADISRRAQGIKEATLHAGPGELQVVVTPVQKS